MGGSSIDIFRCFGIMCLCGYWAKRRGIHIKTKRNDAWDGESHGGEISIIA